MTPLLSADGGKVATQEGLAIEIFIVAVNLMLGDAARNRHHTILTTRSSPHNPHHDLTSWRGGLRDYMWLQHCSAGVSLAVSCGKTRPAGKERVVRAGNCTPAGARKLCECVTIGLTTQ